MATDTEIQTVTFESKGLNLRLIRQDAIVAVTAQGQAYNAAEAINVDFEPFGKVTFRRGEQMLADGPIETDELGRMVLDDRNQPVRAQQDAIDWLIRHREFGIQFWAEGLQPGTALPLEAEFIDAVMNATFGLNASFLSRLREQELRTHARPTLMAAVDNALIRVTMERERQGEDAPVEEDWELPSANSPFDLVKRPVGAAEEDHHAAQAAALAHPDDPSYAGGVR